MYRCIYACRHAVKNITRPRTPPAAGLAQATLVLACGGNVIGIKMDHKCPNCQHDLQYKLLKLKPVASAKLGKKINVPKCPKCDIALIRNSHQIETFAGAAIIFTGAIFMLALSAWGGTVAAVLSGIYAIFVVAIQAVYKKIKLKNWKLWRLASETL